MHRGRPSILIGVSFFISFPFQLVFCILSLFWPPCRDLRPLLSGTFIYQMHTEIKKKENRAFFEICWQAPLPKITIRTLQNYKFLTAHQKNKIELFPNNLYLQLTNLFYRSFPSFFCSFFNFLFEAGSYFF